jgi:hypothetical protein
MSFMVFIFINIHPVELQSLRDFGSGADFVPRALHAHGGGFAGSEV